MSNRGKSEAGKSETLGKDWATYSSSMLKEPANKKLRTGKRHGGVRIKNNSTHNLTVIFIIILQANNLGS